MVGWGYTILPFRIYTDRTFMPREFSLHIALLDVTKIPHRKLWLSLILTVSKLLLTILALYFFISNCECISSVSSSKTNKILNVNKTYSPVGNRPVKQRTSMLKACIFPKSRTINGVEFLKV